MPKKDWRHYIPFYAFFTQPPTMANIAFKNLQNAEVALQDAKLSVIEAQAEVTKRETIYQYVVNA